MKRQIIIKTLQASKSNLFSKYPLKTLALFGSYARNEANSKSDIDILVEFNQPVGFEFVDLAMDLEEILHQKIDLVSKKAIKANMLPYIEKDMIYV